MNGVDAVVMAMGNDWRAIESAAHAFAVQDGQYRGLSQWRIEDDQLTGTLTLPLPVGTVGGATKVLPLVGINQKIARVHSPQDLMKLIAAVGLAQNFAAIKALVTNGIQQGHMKMQIRSLAMSVGATSLEVPALTEQLMKQKDPNEAQARQLLEQIRNNKEDNHAKR